MGARRAAERLATCITRESGMNKAPLRSDRAKSIARWENEGGAGRSPSEDERDAGKARAENDVCTSERPLDERKSKVIPTTAMARPPDTVSFTSSQYGKIRASHPPPAATNSSVVPGRIDHPAEGIYSVNTDSTHKAQYGRYRRIPTATLRV